MKFNPCRSIQIQRLNEVGCRYTKYLKYAIKKICFSRQRLLFVWVYMCVVILFWLEPVTHTFTQIWCGESMLTVECSKLQTFEIGLGIFRTENQNYFFVWNVEMKRMQMTLKSSKKYHPSDCRFFNRSAISTPKYRQNQNNMKNPPRDNQKTLLIYLLLFQIQYKINSINSIQIQLGKKVKKKYSQRNIIWLWLHKTIQSSWNMVTFALVVDANIIKSKTKQCLNKKSKIKTIKIRIVIIAIWNIKRLLNNLIIILLSNKFCMFC